MKKCPECNGTGVCCAHPVCHHCDGTGLVKATERPKKDWWYWFTKAIYHRSERET